MNKTKQNLLIESVLSMRLLTFFLILHFCFQYHLSGISKPSFHPFSLLYNSRWDTSARLKVGQLPVAMNRDINAMWQSQEQPLRQGVSIQLTWTQRGHVNKSLRYITGLFLLQASSLVSHTHSSPWLLLARRLKQRTCTVDLTRSNVRLPVALTTRSCLVSSSWSPEDASHWLWCCPDFPRAPLLGGQLKWEYFPPLRLQIVWETEHREEKKRKVRPQPQEGRAQERKHSALVEITSCSANNNKNAGRADRPEPLKHNEIKAHTRNNRTYSKTFLFIHRWVQEHW